MTNREILCEMGYEDSVVYESYDYDSAIIGVTNDDRVVYDYDKMVAYLVREQGMSEMDAIEWIDYNTLNAHCENGPVVMYRLIDIKEDGV